MANPLPAQFLNFPIVDPKTGLPTADFQRWMIQTISRTANLNLDGSINGGSGDIDPAVLAGQISNLDANGVVLPNGIDLSRAYINKFIGYIPDGAGRFSVTAVDAANRALIDFSQAGHTNKNLDNVGDGATYLRRVGDASNDNIIQNGDFTNGTAFWSGMNIVSEADPWAVTRNCGRSNSLASFGNLHNTQVFRVAPGDVYVYDFWYKTGGTGSWRLYHANIADAGGPLLGAPTVWTHYVAQYTVPSGVDYSYSLQFLIANTSSTADTIDLAAVTIRKVRATTDIQDSAVTAVASLLNTSTQTVTTQGAEVSIGSVSVSTNGGDVLVLALVGNSTGSGAFTLKLRKGSLSTDPVIFTFQGVAPYNAWYDDTSPAASQTYSLWVNVAVGAGNFFQTSYVSISVKNTKK